MKPEHVARLATELEATMARANEADAVLVAAPVLTFEDARGSCNTRSTAWTATKKPPTSSSRAR